MHIDKVYKRKAVYYSAEIIWKRMPWFYFMSIALVIIEAIFPVWIAAIPGNILKCSQSAFSIESFTKNMLLIVIITVILGFISKILRKKYEVSIDRIRTSVFRTELMKKLLTLNYELFEGKNTQKIIDDAWKAVWSNNFGIEGLLRSLNNLTGYGIAIVVYLIILIRYSFAVPVSLLALSVVNLYLSHKKDSLLYLGFTVQNELERTTNYINSVSQSVEFGKELRNKKISGFINSWLNDTVNNRVDEEKKTCKSVLPFDSMQSVVSGLTYLPVYGILSIFLWNGKIEVAEFTLCVGLALGFSVVISRAVSEFEKTVKEAESVIKIYDFIGLDNENDKGIDLIKKLKNGDIVFENVTYRYPETTEAAVDNLSCCFKYGTSTAIVGENGCGKSTIVKLICGLIKPERGSIYFGDINVTECGCYARSFILSAAFQDVNQYAMTLGQNIALEEKYSCSEVHEAMIKANMDLKDFPDGINTMLRKDFDLNAIELSGGRLQSLNLARMLYHAGFLSVLDEPTANLDPIAEYEVYSLFQRLSNSGMVIFISHRMASTRFCEKVLVLKNGKLTAEGTHESLLEREDYYREMYEAQSRYYQEVFEPEITNHKGPGITGTNIG